MRKRKRRKLKSVGPERGLNRTDAQAIDPFNGSDGFFNKQDNFSSDFDEEDDDESETYSFPGPLIFSQSKLYPDKHFGSSSHNDKLLGDRSGSGDNQFQDKNVFTVQVQFVPKDSSLPEDLHLGKSAPVLRITTKDAQRSHAEADILEPFRTIGKFFNNVISTIQDVLGCGGPVVSLDPKVRSVVSPQCAWILTRKGYTIEKRMAAGAFGVVFRGTRWTGFGREPIAIKIIDLRKCDEFLKEKFLPRELEANEKFIHPNAVKVYDIIRMSDKIWIMMEFASGGTLQAYCEQQKEPLPDFMVGYFFSQILEAVAALHDLGMAHRDLKLENVLLTKHLIIKLADYGFARYVIEGELSSTFCGTKIFFCPEIISQIPYHPFLADAWALGVMLFGMLTNRWPFHFFQNSEFLWEMRNRAYRRRPEWKPVSPEAKELCDGLMDPNPRTRIRPAQALTHPWIRRYSARPCSLYCYTYEPPKKKKGESRSEDEPESNFFLPSHVK